MIDLANIDFVFLDRDGVLNRKPRPGEYVTCCDELVLLPGVADAVARLNRSARKVIVVTNQRGVALGLYSLEELNRIHCKLADELAARHAHIDHLYFCPHNHGECNCRKPDIGMFEQAFRDFPEARPERCLMVGDSLRDIEAGARAGINTVYVTDDDSRSLDDQKARLLANGVVCSLVELVESHLCPTAAENR